MPISREQLEADVGYLTSQPEWQDEKQRRDYIRKIAIESRSALPADEVDAVVTELWKRSDTRGLVGKATDFATTVGEEALKSVPAGGGAAVLAATDIAGLTDTGSATRLGQGVAGMIDTTGQLLKRLPPGDSLQAERDNALDLLKEEIDNDAIPEGVKDWAAGAFDVEGLDKADPVTRSYVDSIVSGLARKAVQADVGKDDPERVRLLLESDRNPGRTEGDIPGMPGPRDLLADYIATRDPSSFEAFKQRVTETQQQYTSRMKTWAASKDLRKYLETLPEDSLERDLIQRSMAMQESPPDLATAAIPLLRGGKALAAARAAEKSVPLAQRLATGALIEGSQEAGTELLTNPQTTLGEVAYAGAVGAASQVAIEAAATGVGTLTRPKVVEPVKVEVAGETIVRDSEGVLSKVVDPATNGGKPLAPLNPVDPVDAVVIEQAETRINNAAPVVADTEPTVPIEEAPAMVEEAVTPPAAPAVVETPAAPPVAPPVAAPVVEEAAPAPQTPVAAPAAEGVAPPPPTVPEEGIPDTIGVRNAFVDAERKRMGLPTVYEPLRATFGEWWDKAMTTASRVPGAGANLVKDIISFPRVLDAEETALLAHETVTRELNFDRAVEEVNNATEANREAALRNLEYARQAVDEVFNADDLSGTKAGQALVARKLRVNRDYSLAKMESTYRAVANQGAPLSPEEQANIKALHDEIASLRKQIEEYEAVGADAATKAYFDELVREVRKEAKQQAREGKTLTEFLDDAAAKARARIRARGGNVNMGVNPAEIIDHAIIGASYIAKGITTFAEWSAKMIAELGDYVAPYLKEIFPRSQKLHEAEKKVFDSPKARADKRNVEDQVAKNAVEGNPPAERLVFELVKQAVKEGAATIQDAVGKATEVLKKHYPEITPRQVRDLFTGYGKVKYPSQDELSKQLRELRRIGQLVSAIEDAQAKKAPLRSGPQRDQASQQVRELQKELTRVMQENGIERTTAAQQLKTALDGVKSRLRNQIEDLNKQIATGEKAPKKPGVEYDQEAKDLRARRDELKKIADELDGPTVTTPEQRIRAAMSALDRDIADLERRIKEKDFSPRSGDKTPLTEQLQVKRDQRDALREQFNELRDLIQGEPQLTQAEINERAMKNLERSIAELERRIKEQDFGKQQGASPTMTPELWKLRKRRDMLREQLTAMREEVEGKKAKTDEQRIADAEAALEKQVDRLNDRINKGDIDAKKHTDKTPDTARIKNLKAERDSLQSVIKDLRKQKRDAAVDPVQKQLNRDKESLRSRMKKVQDKIDRRDFSKPEKKTPLMDAEKERLQAQLELAQEAYAKMVFERQLANRTPLKRALDTVFELFSLDRLVKTAGDLSAVLNQGGFVFFRNPLLAVKNLGGMMRALKSEEAQKIVQQRIKALPEYASGEMKRAGLYLSMDAGPGASLSKQEEMFMNRWVEKIPTLVGGGIIRGTARAYTTYLDLIRAGSYVLMKNSLVEGGWVRPPQEPTQQRLDKLASFINATSGRGNFGKGKLGLMASQATPFMNLVFFAARFTWSRFEVALGFPLWTAPAGTRALIAQEYAKYLVGVSVATMLLSLAQSKGDKPTEWSLLSSEFGKVRFGDTRVDLFSGFASPLIFLARILAGETKNSKGKIKPLRASDRPLNIFRDRPRKDKPVFGSTDGADVIGDFLRYKLSPVAAILLNAAGGKNAVGEKTDLISETLLSPVPMVLDQSKETAQSLSDRPALAAGLLVAGVLGARVNSYDNTKKSELSFWERINKQAMKLLSGEE